MMQQNHASAPSAAGWSAEETIEWMNTVMLRRRQALIVSLPLSLASAREGREDHAGMLAALLKNIESLGFTFSPELLVRLREADQSVLTPLYATILPVLKEMVGAHVRHNPMYPGFPQQVMQMKEADLYLNALLHYWTGAMPPEHRDQPERSPLLPDMGQMKTIRLTDEAEFLELMRSLAGANGSLSDSDKQDLADALTLLPDPLAILPDMIPYKENAAFIAATLLEAGKAEASQLARFFRTPTDVLRLAAGLSGVDTSLSWIRRLPALTRPFGNKYHVTQGLPANLSPDYMQALKKQQDELQARYHFRNFNRRERRLFLGLLEQMHHPVEDMLLYRETWKRLGELLHPGEMRARYPKTIQAFTVLRRERSVPTVRRAIEQGMHWRIPDVLELLEERPGELMRRLDHLLRTQPARREKILSAFQQALPKAATPVLLQMLAHFRQRARAKKEYPYRVFFPKGNLGKVVAIPNRLPKLMGGLPGEIAGRIEQHLYQRFAELPPLGRVYGNPQLDSIPVPFSQRSASKALRSLPRGSRIAMPPGDTVRLFCWWKNVRDASGMEISVDVDLSLVLLDKNWKHVETLAFYNLKESFGVHSGDITTAPRGASEFIDLSISAVLMNTRARYAMVQLASYSGQPFSSLPECFAGFMMREDPDSGEIFEARTVDNKFDLTVEAQQAVPFAIDLWEHEMIWMDAVLKNRSFRITAAENMTGFQMLGHAFSSMSRVSLGELFRLHAAVRGRLVENMEEADTVFDMEQGITPYQVETILSGYVR